MNAIPDVIFHLPGRFAPGNFFMVFKTAKKWGWESSGGMIPVAELVCPAGINDPGFGFPAGIRKFSLLNKIILNLSLCLLFQ
jgi:hypothetical protein